MPHPRHSPCCSQIMIFQVGAKLVIGQKFGNFHTGLSVLYVLNKCQFLPEKNYSQNSR